MEKINVVVCGDSWMCLDCEHPGTHFSELLGSRYQVTNLARAGVSNVEIAFQLKRAVELAPDYVLLGTTNSDRIEMPIADTDNIKETLRLEHFRPGNNRSYLSLNINSTGYGEIAPYMTEPRLNALKQYLLYIHDYKLKREVDNWIIEHWLTQLRNNKILYHVFDQSFTVYGDWKINRPIYHTTYDIQKTAAKWVDNHLNNIFNS